MSELEEGHVQVGKKIYGESTQIVLTVKTLYIIIGVIISAFFGVYGLVKSDINSVKEDSAKSAKNTTQIVEKLKMYELKPVEEKVQQHDRDIGILLDRTNSRREVNNTNAGPTVNNTPPPGN